MKINSEKLWDYIFNLGTGEKVLFKVFYDDNYVTDVFWDGENFNWESGKFTSGAFFNPLYDFIPEEDYRIEKLNYKAHFIEDEEVLEKINEIIEEVNKLKEDK